MSKGNRTPATRDESPEPEYSSVFTARFGRGFSERNLQQMRKFYQAWSIRQTASAELDGGCRGESKIPETVSTESQGPPAAILQTTSGQSGPPESFADLKSLASEIERTQRRLADQMIEGQDA